MTQETMVQIFMKQGVVPLTPLSVPLYKTLAVGELNFQSVCLCMT